MTKIKDLRKLFIDRRNRKRLTNVSPTLISSNCAAGMIYHWLGLEFRSPFINLWMTNSDFLTAMENLDDFLATELKEDKSGIREYPVGIGYKGVRIFFLHYRSWEEAASKWKERIPRIDRGNMAVMLTNFKTPIWPQRRLSGSTACRSHTKWPLPTRTMPDTHGQCVCPAIAPKKG